MSYMRTGHPLRWFDDESHLYVFSHCDGFVEDYEADYEHKPSLIEMIGEMVEGIVEDEEYANKIVRVMAKDYGVEDKLRPKRLTIEELMKIYVDKYGTKEQENDNNED